MISLMDAIYFTLLFKALVMGGWGVGHKYISMTPSIQKSHQAMASTQMHISAALWIWKNALVMSSQRGKVLL